MYLTKECGMGLNIKDLRISSPAFQNGGRLEDKCAMEKGNASPPLRISGVPKGAVELALICHDPDAPLPRGYTHWTLYGIPAEATELGSDADEKFSPGPNSNGNYCYDGPQPPHGHGPHHYYFWLYALDKPVTGTPTRAEFLDQYGEHIIEQNRLVGVYER
jgi:Raf kinase inhibitor-like YbhB/YbcL family protein